MIDPNQDVAQAGRANQPATGPASTYARALAEIGALGRIGAIEIDLMSGAMEWTDSVPGLLGFEIRPAMLVSDFLWRLAPRARHNLLRRFIELRDRSASFDVSVELPSNVGDGHRLFRCSARRLHGDIGHHRLVVVIREADEEEMLVRKSRRELDQALEMAQIGAWSINLDTNEVTWSDEVFRIHDMEPGIAPTLEETAAFYPPEAARVVKSSLGDLMAGRGPYDEVLPLVTAKGREIRVRTIGNVERDSRGNPVRLFGVFQDVTQQYIAKQRHEANEARLIRALEATKNAAFDQKRSA